MKKYVEKLKKTLDRINEKQIQKLADNLWATYQKGGTVYTCGNGGSGSTASHFSGDITKTIGIKSFCLNDNNAILTAIGNDLNYNRIFSEQIIKRQVFHPDTVIFFSGSGESNNILEAIQESNDGIIVPWAIIGFSGKQLDDKDCNVLHIPVNDMEVYEDCALIVCHILKRKLQEKMVEAENKIL